jgi:8-oxo-dGTP pyrophosphatase MutT (NUDIX family)
MPISPYVREMRKHIGHELLMLPSVSAVIVNDANEILLGKRSDTGSWSLIAGAIDPGEQPAEAVLREIEEEAGIVAAVERLVGVASHPVVYPNGDRCEYVSMWFRCRLQSGEAHVADDESVDMQWFAPDALPEVSDWTRLVIARALSDEGSAWFAEPGSRNAALHPMVSSAALHQQ